MFSAFQVAVTPHGLTESEAAKARRQSTESGGPPKVPRRRGASSGKPSGNVLPFKLPEFCQTVDYPLGLPIWKYHSTICLPSVALACIRTGPASPDRGEVPRLWWQTWQTGAALGSWPSTEEADHPNVRVRGLS